MSITLFTHYCVLLPFSVLFKISRIDRNRFVSYIAINIKSNPMHPVSGALPLPYVPATVTRGALVAHRHSFAPPRCRTSQYRRTFVPLSVSLRNNLSDPVFDGVGLAGFKSRANAFLLA